MGNPVAMTDETSGWLTDSPVKDSWSKNRDPKAGAVTWILFYHSEVKKVFLLSVMFGFSSYNQKTNFGHASAASTSMRLFKRDQLPP
jgi:hypothetical protein